MLVLRGLAFRYEVSLKSFLVASLLYYLGPYYYLLHICPLFFCVCFYSITAASE